MATLRLRTGSAAAALVALLALSCGPSRQDRAAGARESRGAVISDAVHNGGVPGFFFLPPMVPAAAYGEFRAGLAPEVVIERLPLGSAPPVATFTAAEIQTESDSHYKVSWDTRASSLDPAATYRIRVKLRWFELGFADVDVVSSGSELRNVATGEFIALLDGRTLPIKFRIEPAAMRCPDRPEGQCQAIDQCHDAGVCNPADGTCSNPPRANGTPCADGNACTQTDTCQAGACTGADPVACTASDQCHDAGECNPADGVCSDPPKADGAACNDGDLCTQTDACQAGACAGSSPVVCTASDQCHDPGVCNPADGVCSNPAKPESTACDDGDACTQTDACLAGSCTGSNPVVCTALDQCHDAGMCNPLDGTCSNPPNTGALCSDGNACTQADTCLAGTCIGASPVVCEALDRCHVAGICDPSSGACSNPPEADGVSCTDGNACTQADTCQAGTCTGEDPVVCAALDQCHDVGTCDPSTGACSNPPNTGATCDDGNACSRTDTCQAGTCTGSDPVVCEALDQCHDPGACDPGTGRCAMSAAKSDGSACDDGDACTRTDTCEKGLCAGANPIVCTAPNECHEPGTCDPGTGTCSAPTAKVDGTLCTGDGNFCTKDACEDGTCLAAVAPVDCTDFGELGHANLCTRDECDPTAAGPDGVTGCVHAPWDRNEPELPADVPLTCWPALPPPTITIVGFSPPQGVQWGDLELHVNDRVSVALELHASDDYPDAVACPDQEATDCPRYQVEFVLYKPLPDGGVDAVSLGTRQLPLVSAGPHAYWVELAIPGTLQPGEYHIAAHEYPAGKIYPDDTQPPILLEVVADAKPVLDVLELEVAQSALLIDEASTVGVDPTVRLETPYSARLDVVSHNVAATGMPVKAQVTWNGATFPLWIWDAAAGRWTDTLVLDPLEAEAPTSVFLDLAMAEGDAQRIRPGPEIVPVEAPVQVTVTVNESRAGEGTCVPVDDPSAPVNCRHSAERPALVFPAPPPPDEQPFQVAAAAPAPFAAMMSLAESGNTQPLTYEKAWSKTIGNQWAGAGIEFKGFAQMSQAGYVARVEGGVPLSVLQNTFDFVRAKASAEALVEEQAAHARVNVSALGITVYDWSAKPEVNLETQFAKVEKEKQFQKTVIVYIVPVTFKLGASGTLGLVGNLSASYVPGTGALEDKASLTLSAGPYVTVEAFGSAELGTAFFGAGARVTLTLIDALLKGEVTGSLVLTKTDYGWPAQITGGLSERLWYETSFLTGRVGLVVTYPVVRWCRFWGVPYPCGLRVASKEAVLCSWPGFSYGQDLLNLSQTLFTIDLPECPRVACGNHCGRFNDGCEWVDCGTCTAPNTCGGGGAEGICGCTPEPCGDRCGWFENGCGGVDCGQCGDAHDTCNWDGNHPNACGCTPTATCEGKCGTLDDGCGVQLSCPDCPAGEICGGGGPNLCGTCQPDRVCEGRCGTFADGCGGTTTCTAQCPEGTTCGGGGVPNVCGCTPTTTCDGKCGTLFDGCTTLTCDGCPDGQTCGGAGVPNVCAPYQPFQSGYAWLGSAFDFSWDDEFWIDQTDLDRAGPPVHQSYTGDSNTWYGAQWLANKWKQQVAPGGWTPSHGMADVYLRDSQSDCQTFYLAFHVGAQRAPGSGAAYYQSLTRDQVAAYAPSFARGYFVHRGSPYADPAVTYAVGDVFVFWTVDSDAPGAPTRLGKLLVTGKYVDSNWWTNECWGGVGFSYVIFDHQPGYYW